MTKLASLENPTANSSLQQTPLLDPKTKLYVFDREMMLLGKSGGVAIEAVDDATAVHYFIQWLYGKRVEAMKRKGTINQIVCATAVGGDQSVD